MITTNIISTEDYLLLNNTTIEEFKNKQEDRLKARELSNRVYRIKYRNRYYHEHTKHSARRRKLEFNLSKEFMTNLLAKQNNKCIFSGLEISLSNATASLDRIDSSKGYTEDNVQWVHKDVNFMKHKMNNQEFIEMCKLITKNQN